MEPNKQEAEPTRLQEVARKVERVEDKVDQWMLLEEHFTEYKLKDSHRLENARALFKAIKAEIKEAYKVAGHLAYAE